MSARRGSIGDDFGQMLYVVGEPLLNGPFGW